MHVNGHSVFADTHTLADLFVTHIRQLMQGRNVEESFHWLFQRYHTAVSGFFFRKGFSSEDCRDLTQDVFFAVYTSVKNLRSEGAFVTWLFSIANNTALRHWERQKKHSRLQLVPSRDVTDDSQAASEVERVAALEPDPLSQLLHLERVEVVGDALRKLPDMTLARVILHGHGAYHRSGLSHNQANKKLNVTT